MLREYKKLSVSAKIKQESRAVARKPRDAAAFSKYLVIKDYRPATFRLRKIGSPSADQKYSADHGPQEDPSAILITSLITDGLGKILFQLPQQELSTSDDIFAHHVQALIIKIMFHTLQLFTHNLHRLHYVMV